MYAPRPSSKVPTFRACSARQDDTFILSSYNDGRESGSQFNLFNVLDERTARKVRSRVATRIAACSSEKCIWHEFRLRRRSISSKDKPARIDAHSKSGELCEVPTREITDLAVAFYAHIMQQECNKTARALINKYT